MSIELLISYNCHGGSLGYYRHDSEQTKTQMRFTMFTPPDETRRSSCLIFLAGLTCTEENFTTKANAYKKAAKSGLHILAPDTSPRGNGVTDDDSPDLGQGAGFYIDALKAPWDKNFRMESYIMHELLPMCASHFKLDKKEIGITGYSMGGHGALTLYLKHPESLKTCSAFSPIVAPSQVPWGQKAFQNYLGENKQEWLKHDATALVKHSKSKAPILIDQGLKDEFLDS